MVETVSEAETVCDLHQAEFWEDSPGVRLHGIYCKCTFWYCIPLTCNLRLRETCLLILTGLLVVQG